jgi:tRNA A-37 threonylcarbamoyl transferase component Bud32
MYKQPIPNYKITAVRTLAENAHVRFAESRQPIDANLAMVYGAIEDNMIAISAIETAINKLPTKQEFEEVKEELRRKVKEVNQPTKEELRRFKEVEKRVKHVYR